MSPRIATPLLAGLLVAAGAYYFLNDESISHETNSNHYSSITSSESDPNDANGIITANKSVSLPKKDNSLSGNQSVVVNNESLKTYKAFKEWQTEYAQNKSDKAFIEKGIEIAEKRRAFIEDDIKNRPRRALRNSLSYSAYSNLPESIKPLIEEPITVVADLKIFPDENSGVEDHNTVAIFYEENGERVSHNITLYGDRKRILSKNNLSIQGIRLGKLAAIDDQAFQVVIGNDVSWAENKLALANNDKNKDYFTDEVIVGEPIKAVSQGQLYYFANESNVDALNLAMTQLENQMGPNSHLLEKSGMGNTVLPASGVSLKEQYSQQVLQASTWTETKKKMFFIRVDFSDNTGESVSKANLESVVNGSVSTLISNFSYRKTDIEGALSGTPVEASSQVVRMPQPGSYYSNLDNTSFANGSVALHADAKTAFDALGTSINLNDFDIVGVHFANIGMPYAGLASVGGGNHWIQSTTAPNVIAHELGHNYGLGHANYWDTGGNSVVGAGAEIGYGDIYDTMGNQSSGDFHVQAKSRLNWLPSSEWIDVSASGTYRIYRFDQDTLNTNNKALRVTKGSNEYYWLGYRRDFTSNTYSQNGAYIIWQRPNATNSVLIDTTPGSSDGKNDAGITLGRTYSDATADIHVTTIDQGGSGTDEWLDIQVNIGTQTGNQDPSVTITPPAALSARTPLVFTATASDPDGDTLAYDWDFGDGKIQSNVSNVTQKWTVGGNYTIKVTVSDMKGGTASHELTVTVVDPVAQWSDRTSNVTDNIVDIAASDTLAVAITNFAVIGSTDGTTWSQLSGRPSLNTYLRSIIYDGNQWVAVGQDYSFSASSWQGAVYTSPDASTWTERYKGGNRLRAVTSSGSVLVAVGDNGEAIRSTDSGVTWSAVSTGISTRLINIAYGNSQFIAVGSYFTGGASAMATSTDGLTWTDQTSSSGVAASAGYSAIEYFNDKFIGAAVNSRLGYLEDNGGIAFLSTRSNREEMPALMYGNGIYFGAGRNQDDSYNDLDVVSEDGKSWTTSSTTTSVPDRNSGVFFKDTFITVGDNGSIRQSGIFTAAVADNDSDGYDDTVETNVPNANDNNTGDGNGDGTDDNNQSDVTSFQANDGTSWLTYANTSSAAQSNFATSGAPVTVPADNQLVLGTTQFDLATTAGAVVTIEVYVAQDTSIKDYLLLSNDGEWYAQNATVTHAGNKTKLVFTVTEGGEFDRDATANGTLQLAEGGVMVESGLDIWPYAYLYGNVDLNTQTTAKSFSVKNTGSRALTITTVGTTGNDASEFVINNDGCSGQTLAADTDCTISASFQPTSIGSKSALIKVSTNDPDNASASIFVRNHEADEEESERRLPPVLNAFEILDSSSQPVTSMQSNTEYTVEWSILGYHEDYISSVVMFNCTGIADNTTCGANFTDSTRFLSSGQVNRYQSVNGLWQHQGIQSKVNQYRYTFTTPTVANSTPIVIRFYRLNSKDLQAGNGGLSLIIPGNHADDYYDTTGRRVKSTITP
ncbi:MAG: Unknown protein [uncultured Thiotrichaceae bacterium]|uniref:PKD domain-containing protein n=1 Tax=uncultured Thiotrichaceae bacterium TaxID=298394 RepID=A0A6S6U839_9GAMM|nr:MAG: Unknown protein [uncultured Thiotrichaceae bacterium]